MKLLLLIALFCLSACSTTTFGPRIEAPTVHVSPQTGNYFASGSLIDVARFEDKRLTFVEKNTIHPEGKVARKLTRTLIDALENRGVDVSKNADRELQCFLDKWEARYSDVGSTGLRTEAIVTLKIINKKSRFTLFRARFKGSHSVLSPHINEEDIKKSLSKAMAKAMSLLVAHKKFQFAIKG